MNRAARRALQVQAHLEELAQEAQRQADHNAGRKRAKIVRAGRSCFEVRTGKFLYGSFTSMAAAIGWRRELRKQCSVTTSVA